MGKGTFQASMTKNILKFPTTCSTCSRHQDRPWRTRPSKLFFHLNIWEAKRWVSCQLGPQIWGALYCRERQPCPCFLHFHPLIQWFLLVILSKSPPFLTVFVVNYFVKILMSLCLGYLNTYIVIDSHSIENSISPNFLPVKREVILFKSCNEDIYL